MKSSSCVADFDSATAMLRALSNYLKAEDFPLVGAMPRRNLPLMKLVAGVVNHLPVLLRDQVYIWSGRFEAINPRKLAAVSTDEIAEWMTTLYPKRKYPAAAVGSSNGAAVHLWSALGIPWLPQTFLIPVARAGVHPDEPLADAQWAQEPARAFLKENTDVQLHHMNDPVQDRLMIQRMTYFRVKRRRLGKAYETFLLQSLQPGAIIFVMDCRLKWPTTQYDERYFFQFGALGGATAEEYHHGSERVENYLSRHRSHLRRWTPPPPDADRPEAEWGFEPLLEQDLMRFAERYGFQVRRIIFDEPEHFSPFVADLYQWWNHKRDISDRRLLVESFIVMEPYWTARTGAIPFWMVFNKEPSAQALEAYLRQQAFEEIYLMLFSHGVNSIGLVSIERWRRGLAFAQRSGSFIGVDPEAYPRDFGVFVRYNPDLKRKISARYPIPPPLRLQDFERFLAESAGRYQIKWQSEDLEGMLDRVRSRLYRLRRLKRQLICLLLRRFERFSCLLPATTPLPSKHYESDKRSEELLVFLPGVGDLAEDYELNGFIDAVRRAEIPVDMTIADMHLGYYVTRSAVERLRQDIILPARTKGHKRISLVGISLGGFGALYYAMHHPDDVVQLFLLAPYLGDRNIIAEISMAGGIKQWIPKTVDESDYQRKLWQWLKSYSKEKSGFPKLYLAYGLQDQFATANKLLAELLPRHQIHEIPGKHDWITWTRLWKDVLIDIKQSCL